MLKKRNLIVISLLTTTLFSLQVSAMQKKTKTLEILHENQNITLETLKGYKDFFRSCNNLFTDFYLEIFKKIKTNEREIIIYSIKDEPIDYELNENLIKEIEEKEKEYNEFFEQINHENNNQYIELNKEIIDNINKLKNIINTIKETKENFLYKLIDYKKQFTDYYNLFSNYYEKEKNENLIENLIKEIEKKEKEYIEFFEQINHENNNRYIELNKEIIDNINKLKNIINTIKKTEENFLYKLINYKKQFTDYYNLLSNYYEKEKNENLIKEIEEKEQEYKEFFEQIPEQNKKICEKTILEIKDIIYKIKENIKDPILYKLNEYKILFSSMHYKITPYLNESEKISNWIKINKNIIKERANEIEKIKNKIDEYKSFYEKIKKTNNKKYEEINKKIKDIILQIEEDNIFFENLKNLKNLEDSNLKNNIHKIEQKLSEYKEKMIDAENDFSEKFKYDAKKTKSVSTIARVISIEENSNEIDLLNEMLNYIEKYLKLFEDYEKYKEKIKKEFKNSPYLSLIEKLLNYYDRYSSNIYNIINFNIEDASILYSKIKNKIKKNIKKENSYNYEKRLINLINLIKNYKNTEDEEYESEIKNYDSKSFCSDDENLKEIEKENLKEKQNSLTKNEKENSSNFFYDFFSNCSIF